MNEKKIKESKQQFQFLAELCNNIIYENNFLEEKKLQYNKQLNIIKSILKNKNNSLNIKKELKQIHESLIKSNNSLKKENSNLYNKLSSFKDKISKDGIFSDKQKLTNVKSDNLLLIYQLKEKEYIIKRLSRCKINSFRSKTLT